MKAEVFISRRFGRAPSRLVRRGLHRRGLNCHGRFHQVRGGCIPLRRHQPSLFHCLMFQTEQRKQLGEGHVHETPRSRPGIQSCTHRRHLVARSVRLAAEPPEEGHRRVARARVLWTRQTREGPASTWAVFGHIGGDRLRVPPDVASTGANARGGDGGGGWALRPSHHPGLRVLVRRRQVVGRSLGGEFGDLMGWKWWIREPGWNWAMGHCWVCWWRPGPAARLQRRAG